MTVLIILACLVAVLAIVIALRPSHFRIARSAHVDVTWATQGDNNFMMKAFGLFMNTDKMVGADYERGLAAMKAQAEGK